jgi:hypothetical protein
MVYVTRRQFLQSVVLTPPMMALAGCGSGASALQAAAVHTVPWPEAEALFHQDPRWLGGDGVYSIDLGQGRVLWLFGDSFIATSAANKRSQATLVRNSLAIQTGYDPATATMQFFWSNSGNSPGAFFNDPNSPKWYWPAHGVRIGSALLIFLAETQPSSGGLGFAGSGWKAALIENPDATPDQWNVGYIAAPNQFSLVVGSAVTVVGDTLYAYSHSDTDTNIYLARCPLAEAGQGILTHLEWFNGSSGWVLQSNLSHAPAPIMGNGQTEFNVTANPPHTPFLEVQTDGFGAAVLACRTSGAPTGPWSSLAQFYRPPEASQPDILIYSAKTHPMLTNSLADFVVSYSTNSTSFSTLVNDTSLYYPRFVRATWQ